MKKLITVLLCVALIRTSFVVSANELQTEIATPIAPVEQLIPCEATVADVNGDFAVNSSGALLISNYVVSKIHSFY